MKRVCPRRGWREVLLLLVALAASVLVVLGAALTAFRSHTEFLLYPALQTTIDSYDPHARNVLLLGGSVLYLASGLFEDSRPDASIRFYNLAAPSHTSLDSRYKYEYLVSRGLRFDTVIFYEGINEVRTNNIPPALFRENYGHYGYYRLAHKVFAEKSLLALLVQRSETAFQLYRRWLDFTQGDAMIPVGNLGYGERPEWLRYGGEIKSASEFRKNLAAIAELAARQKARLIVPQFAYNLPADYTREGFLRGTVGYAQYPKFREPCPTEIWGLPANVVKGIEAHNRVLGELRDRFTYLSTAELSADIANFVDICRFSLEGARRFVLKVNTALYGEM